MEQLNSIESNSIFEIIIHKYIIGLMIDGKLVWLQEEDRNEDISIVLICQCEAFFFFKKKSTARNSARRDAPRSHSEVLHLGNNDSSRGTCRTSAVLVGGGSSECGLLLEPSSVLNGGLGGELWRKSLTSGSRLRHTWNHGLVRSARAECFLTQ